MSIFERFLSKYEEPEEPKQDTTTSKERFVGRIIKLDRGWGFIVSPEIPYRRIFFHWSGLNQDTKLFTELEKGMDVEFETLEIEGRGIRAIKIKVLDNAQ